MNREKKVIIFIVEGGSDKIFFGEYKKIFTNHHVLIHVVKGDIFTNHQLKNRSTNSVVKEIINKVIKDNSVLGVTLDDVDYIYQITDIDNCFQKDKFSNESLSRIRQIKAEKINAIIELQRYSKKDRGFDLLFFSPNLEGALTPRFDSKNADGVEKSKNMLKLIREINSKGNIEDQLNKMIDNPMIAPFSEYFESWDYIRRDNNCKKANTNLKLIKKGENNE